MKDYIPWIFCGAAIIVALAAIVYTLNFMNSCNGQVVRGLIGLVCIHS